MVLIKGKEYITVAERINTLHKESNNVDILTEILSNDETVVLVVSRQMMWDKKD